MMSPKRPKDDQSKLFIEKARELGVGDDDDGVADEVMRRLAAQRKPSPRSKMKPKVKKPAK